MLSFFRSMFKGEGDGCGSRECDKLFTKEDPKLTAKRQAAIEQMKARGQQTLLEGRTWVPGPHVLS